MTKSFECAQGGVRCGAEITGETDDEVLGKAVAHAREEHGVDLASSQTLSRYAASLIHDEDAPPGEAARSTEPGK